jgi:hypothetical protein
MSRHIRQSPVDGKWRRWELKSAVTLGWQDPEDAAQKRSDGSRCEEFVQVCTGVFDTKQQAKRDTYGFKS